MFARNSDISRRDVLKLSGAGAFALTIARAWNLAEAQTQTKAQAAPGAALPPLNRFPRMVQEHMVDQVAEIERRRLRAFNALKTREDAERHVESVRQRIRESFGPFPEKTPLNPKITGTVERDAYRIENIIFESRPGFLVTANLYLPKGANGPRPGVVGSCGHSANGKAAEAYQSFSQGLARQGYVVLIFDPIGQGERLQYPKSEDDLTSAVGVGVREHLLAGNQQVLVGENLANWRAWDGIRALDYLQTRPEVDPKQIGVTGNSGGGTMTTWLCGVEQRWAMAAPSCFVTTFRRNLENELPADIEQCPPRALALGLDHEDFLAALAPKPIIVLGKEKDFFDVRGTIAAYERLKRLYSLLGAADDVALFVGPTEHGYTQENREAMYGWFNRVTGIAEGQKEPELTIEPDEVLQCTERGQVAVHGSRSVPEFTREKAKALRERRPKLEPSDVPGVVAQVLDIDPAERRPAPHYRILRPLRSRNFPKRYAVPYAVESEPGIQALVYRLYDASHVSRPPANAGRAILYISHQSSDAELRDEPLIRSLIEAEPEAAVYACDVRGIGESRPDTCGTDAYRDPYGADYFYAAHSLMLDRPYPARRTRDVLTVLDWLRSLGHDEVHLAARGWGAIPATFAALLHDSVGQVTLKEALTSYSDLAESERYDWPLSSLLPGVLAHFDLPDCYAALAATRRLSQVEPRGAQG